MSAEITNQRKKEYALNCIENFKHLIAVVEEELQNDELDNDAVLSIIACARLAQNFDEKAQAISENGRLSSKKLFQVLAETHIEEANLIYNTIKDAEKETQE